MKWTHWKYMCVLCRYNQYETICIPLRFVIFFSSETWIYRWDEADLLCHFTGKSSVHILKMSSLPHSEFVTDNTHTHFLVELSLFVFLVRLFTMEIAWLFAISHSESNTFKHTLGCVSSIKIQFDPFGYKGNAQSKDSIPFEDELPWHTRGSRGTFHILVLVSRDWWLSFPINFEKAPFFLFFSFFFFFFVDVSRKHL